MEARLQVPGTSCCLAQEAGTEREATATSEKDRQYRNPASSQPASRYHTRYHTRHIRTPRQPCPISPSFSQLGRISNSPKHKATVTLHSTSTARGRPAEEAGRRRQPDHCKLEHSLSTFCVLRFHPSQLHHRGVILSADSLWAAW